MIVNTNTRIDSPVRQVKAKVELFSGSTLTTWTDNDRITKITIERPIDDTKFFGYGICQKANVHLIDLDREIGCTTNDKMDIHFTTEGDEFDYILPVFQVTRCNRDENTNELSITAYDAIYHASEHAVSELDLPDLSQNANDGYVSYTLGDFVSAIADVLGVDFSPETHLDVDFGLIFDNSYDYTDITPSYYAPNYEGTETLRDVLDDVAEITQTIYYINYDNQLVFKRLDINGDPVLTIDKHKYITLSSGDSRRLTKLVHTTALSDNISAEMEITGTTQYIHDNPLWNLRGDIEQLMEEALAAVGGLTINQFDCDWRGNWYLEIGDKIGLVTKDDDIVYAYLLNDTIEYNGRFRQRTQWSYVDNEVENVVNPLPLGERLKQTYATVDKLNQKIELVVRDMSDVEGEMASLRLTTDEILAKVKDLDIDNLGNISEELASLRVTSDAITQEVTAVKQETDALGVQVETLTQSVSNTVTAEEVEIIVKETLDDGITTNVITETGFTFDKDGLTISKADHVMSTQITEDGMNIYRGGDIALTVNNEGVKAANLHATTYLIIGGTSRFEDYANNTRTGCFWIREDEEE